MINISNVYIILRLSTLSFITTVFGYLTWRRVTTTDVRCSPPTYISRDHITQIIDDWIFCIGIIRFILQTWGHGMVWGCFRNGLQIIRRISYAPCKKLKFIIVVSFENNFRKCCQIPSSWLRLNRVRFSPWPMLTRLEFSSEFTVAFPWLFRRRFSWTA